MWPSGRPRRARSCIGSSWARCPPLGRIVAVEPPEDVHVRPVRQALQARGVLPEQRDPRRLAMPFPIQPIGCSRRMASGRSCSVASALFASTVAGATSQRAVASEAAATTKRRRERSVVHSSFLVTFEETRETAPVGGLLACFGSGSPHHRSWCDRDPHQRQSVAAARHPGPARFGPVSKQRRTANAARVAGGCGIGTMPFRLRGKSPSFGGSPLASNRRPMCVLRPIPLPPHAGRAGQPGGGHFGGDRRKRPRGARGSSCRRPARRRPSCVPFGRHRPLR